MSNKYMVYVTGNLDWEYEIEAETPDNAMSEAELKFGKEFRDITWSAIQADSWEQTEGDDGQDDGY